VEENKIDMGEIKARRIKACLIMKGIKQSEIARKLNLNRSAVTNIIKGRKKSQKIVDALRDYGVPENYLR